MKLFRTLFLFLAIMSTLIGSQAQINLDYQMPPKAIADLADAELTPFASLSPDGQWLLLRARSSMPQIADLAQPELRLAGLRINPRTNGASRATYSTGLSLTSLQSGDVHAIEGLPENPRIGSVSWSPNAAFIGFTQTTDTGIELWVVEVTERRARRLTGPVLNAAMRGSRFNWLPDSRTMVYKAILTDRGEAPQEPLVPKGPIIQENMGKVAAVRTYQDLLKNPFDEALFSYYTNAQLYKITVDGEKQALGQPGMIESVSPSPNGEYLLVEQLQKPFSYLVPYHRFPSEVSIWNMQGEPVKKIADVPLGEDIPKGFMAVRTGPRSFSWRADAPASLYWVEAQDEGDPRKEVEVRDRLYHLDAPFQATPQADLDFTLRYAGINWGTDELAIAYEYWWNTRRRITSRFSPAKSEAGKSVIFDRSWEDRYNDPGNFSTHTNAYGRSVLLTDAKGKHLFLTGQGASPEGNRPFVDRYELASAKTERLWRSEAPHYEYPAAILDPQKLTIITARESKDEPGNFFIRNLKKDKMTQITDFQHPYPGLKGVKKELVRYERKDGVQLTGTLYTPPGYNAEKDGSIPVLLWAYPEEFKSADAAGQVSGSPYRFVRLYGGSPLFWLTQGYAILDDPGMPIIGEGDEEPNDNFVSQLVMNAEAAIDHLVELGVADRNRIAVGGHSYGAFMTANLLAHSDLFACGIARSGAYNRTLTPFGFQAEERTFWEAPEIYFTMSPFMHADKIKEPLLMLHGEADNNSGTYPMQSERFYNALKGHGAQVRLVMLPHESHGYRARESVMHMLWEMHSFMEKHLGKGFAVGSR